ncbi:HPP family protein [Uliginosibacterium sp. H3]|uniref:HPP family protein n=1 Tax=Uliginosibacterium silvisoli TaxID=3114758 RepID=A0ABU6JZR3_9RHOO|nr:HPP family protein [Uliginosibacterium sp. H3]
MPSGPESQHTQSPLRARLRSLIPLALGGDAEERIRSCVGALLGILITGLISHKVLGAQASLWLIAPMGASAVLLFAVPSSPLAQPWSIIGGNFVAAIVGVACWHALQDPLMAASAAIGIAIGLMLVLRCLHPPSGAVALTAVLGGAPVHALGMGFVLNPVMLNSFCLLAVAIAYNRFTGRNYPHRPLGMTAAQKRMRDTPPEERLGFTVSDLDNVLREYNQVIDIDRDDLQALFMQAEVQAYRRRFGEITCGDIMAREVISVQFATTLEEAWREMRTHGIKALPVLDRARRVVGIVTQADFMKSADLDSHEQVGSRLRHLLRRTPGTHSDKPEVVGQIMSKQPQTASVDTHVASLVPLLGGKGHSHIPIVDGERRLVGIVTPRDLIVALYRGSLDAA